MIKLRRRDPGSLRIEPICLLLRRQRGDLSIDIPVLPVIKCKSHAPLFLCLGVVADISHCLYLPCVAALTSSAKA